MKHDMLKLRRSEQQAATHDGSILFQIFVPASTKTQTRVKQSGLSK